MMTSSHAWRSEVYLAEGPAPLDGEEVRRRIRNYLRATQVERAILFGSFARGTQDFASDIDLLVVEATPLPFLERGLAHLPLFRLGVGLDLLVYTPEEYERLEREGNQFLEQVACEGVVIYERSPEGRPPVA